MACTLMCAYVNFFADSWDLSDIRCPRCGAVWNGEPGNRTLDENNKGRFWEDEWLYPFFFNKEIIELLDFENQEMFLDFLIFESFFYRGFC